MPAGTYYIRISTTASTGPYVLQPLVSSFETGQEERCLSLLPEADRADPDAPADPLYGCQWHLNNTGQFGGDAMHDINVEEVWETTKGEGVNVAVVDTGLDYEHDDLKENVGPGAQPCLPQRRRARSRRQRPRDFGRGHHRGKRQQPRGARRSAEGHDLRLPDPRRVPDGR